MNVSMSPTAGFALDTENGCSSVSRPPVDLHSATVQRGWSKDANERIGTWT